MEPQPPPPEPLAREPAEPASPGSLDPLAPAELGPGHDPALDPVCPLGIEPYAPPRKEYEPVTALDGFSARVWAVLLSPFAAFAAHDPTWGWARPWALVALVGILAGSLGLMRTDSAAVDTWAWERALNQMGPAQRKQVENPETAEQIAKFRRLQGFFGKVAAVAGPPLLGLGGLVFMGGLLFVIGKVWSPEAPDPLRCFSLAAFVGLANLIDSLGAALGGLLSNPIPRPNLSALVDPFSQPLLSAGLSRLGPGLLLYYVLLAAALQGGLLLSRKRAIAVSGLLYLLASLVLIAFGALGALGQAQQGGA